MRILSTILFLLFTLQVSYSQEKHYFFYTYEQLKENAELNRFKSSYILTIKDTEFSICSGNLSGELVALACISGGTVKQIDDVLYLYDKELNRTYRFREIDFYTIEALNHTAVFVQGTKLYLHLYMSKSYHEYYSASIQDYDLIKSDYWRTGVKNGIHAYQYNNTNPITLKLLYYQNNILIDSVIYNYFNSYYSRDSASIIKEVNFVERYGYPHNVTTYYLNDLELKICREFSYLLTKEGNVISAGMTYDNINFRDINRKYQFSLTENDSLLIVRSFTSTLPAEVPIFNVSDTLIRSHSNFKTFNR